MLPFDSVTIMYFFFNSVKLSTVSGHPEFRTFQFRKYDGVVITAKLMPEAGDVLSLFVVPNLA